MPSRDSLPLLLGLILVLVAMSPLHAAEYKNVKYLPAWRYAGDMAPDRDYQMVMDIAVPDDDVDEHPVLFVVHGGGWSGGSKDQKVHLQIADYFVQRGYVCVRLNYIMRPRGIFPQVFWDYEDAARFMRKNAKTYKVDPTRFGAIGLSAGGWLISSAGHGSGDLLCLNHQQSMHLGELWQRNWSRAGKNQEESFARPMASPRPAYPGVYGRFQAISYDFSFRTKYGSGNSPTCNQWAGVGYQLRPEDQAAVDAGKFDYSQTLMTHPSFQGRKVHVPPLFASVQKGLNKAEAISIDGKSRVDAIERIYQFFQKELVENPRTPAPEIQPAWRIFEKETEVRFVMPMAGAEIRYQIVPLNAAPGKTWSQLHRPVKDTATWDKYTGPFKVRTNCLVRAVATSDGRRRSTVAEAHFFRGVKVARVTAPEATELPPAETGKPYSIQFKSDVQNARWYMAGDLAPFSTRKQTHFSYPNNMVMNYQTGQWRGVPVKPGKYWVQVWVNDRPGALASYRDYTWTVTGKDLSGTADNAAVLEDPNVELVYLPGEKNYPAEQLATVLHEHGIRAIVQKEQQGSLFLVKKDDRAKARKLIESHLQSIKYKGEVRWQ